MTDCPALDELEAVRPSAAIRAHVAACAACRMVVELIDERSFAIAVRTGPERSTPDADCAQVEPLLAARDDGELAPAAAATLAAHLARCADCRLLVERFGPDADTAGDHVELPVIETTAYALGAEVARGGMGRILAARDLRVGRQVAVKELLGRSPALAARFEREARVTARLQHPGIVPIYEIGAWPDGTPFYTMRLVDGRTLREALKAAPTLDARLALLPAVIAATEAVAFAHSKHVIHRDLTPSNILVGAFGETVVIDWGLAKDLADPDAASDSDAGGTVDLGLTGSGQVIGTAMYMPPEQARGEVVDERADVYALGAILYHLLAGTWPYGGRRAEVLAQVVAGPPRPIDAVAPGAPRDLISIVTKAMARTPADRYASARELAEELVRFQTGRLVEAHVYSRRELWRRWIRRHRAALAATAAALIAITIAATISIDRVVTERDRAEAERAAAIAAQAGLLEEQGRQELLAGNPMRAATWLAEAYARGNDAMSLRLLLGIAMRDVELLDRTVACGAEVQSLDVDRSDTRLVAACDDVVKIWRIGDLTELVTLSAPGARLANARFSHDGSMILSWGPDGAARLWDSATGELRRTLVHGAGVHIFHALLTPDDRTVVTTGLDGTARVWNAADGTVVRTIQVSTTLGVRGTLAPDGVTLYTATADGRVTAWDLATGAAMGTIDHGAPLAGGNPSPDGSLASTCGADGDAKIWDPRSRLLVRTLAAHADLVTTCEWSSGGDRLLTTSKDRTAKVWDVATGRVVTSVSVGGVIGDGQFSPDGRSFTIARIDGWLGVYSVETGAVIAAHDDPRGSILHGFSRDGGTLFAVRRDGVVRAIDLRHTRLRAEFTPPADDVAEDATADGTRLVTRRGSQLTVWDVATGRAIAHHEVEASLAAEPADPMIAVGLARQVPAPPPGPFTTSVGADAVARVWDAARRELAAFPVARIAPTMTQVSFALGAGTARFAPDGAVVIVATGVAVWEMPVERRGAAAIGDVLASAPWRIADGQLVERTSRLRIAGASAEPGVTVQAVRLPYTVDSIAIVTKDPPRIATRTPGGDHVVDLPVGRYEVEVVRGGQVVATTGVNVGPDGTAVTVAP